MRNWEGDSSESGRSSYIPSRCVAGVSCNFLVRDSCHLLVGGGLQFNANPHEMHSPGRIPRRKPGSLLECLDFYPVEYRVEYWVGIPMGYLTQYSTQYPTQYSTRWPKSGRHHTLYGVRGGTIPPSVSVSAVSQLRSEEPCSGGWAKVVGIVALGQ